MNTTKVITSQNIELEFELGSLGDRIVGRIADVAVLTVYTLLVFAIIGFENLGKFIFNYRLLAAFVFGLPWIFYHLLSELLLNGQSLGKKLMGIKVISLNGGQASFSQYIIRWLFRVIDFSAFGGLVALIMVAATPKKQRLGDLVAGTVLVKTRHRIQLSDSLYQEVPGHNYEVTYPEVINLRDQDVQLIKEILKNIYQSGNETLALQAQQKIERVLHVSSRHTDPRSFLKAILSDYDYLTSRL